MQSLAPSHETTRPVVYVVDDDADFVDSLATLLTGQGFEIVACDSGANFLAMASDAKPACALVDLKMPAMDGLQLIAAARRRGLRLPIVMMTGFGDVPRAVAAMKAGAMDFIEKPFGKDAALAVITSVLERSRHDQRDSDRSRRFRERVDRLTQRERDVFYRMLEGKPNKIIASELNISPRTIEIHRARVFQKLEDDNVASLLRAAIHANLLSANDRPA